MASHWLYLAGVEDLPRLALGGADTHHSWPPPHTTTSYDPVAGAMVPWEVTAFGTSSQTLFRTVGDTGYSDPDGWWWTTLGDFLLQEVAGHDMALTRVLRYLDVNPEVRAAFDAASIPIIYKAEKGQHMRWIRNTIRGLLGGGVEQFQFKMDWGLPGNDPTFTPAQAQEFAGTSFSNLVANFTGAALHPVGSLFTSDVWFTESGVTMLTQTEATDKDGKGGNLEQAFPTEWYATPTASSYCGTSTDYMPFEVACAVTLLTDTRGPRGRGRCYLPPIAGNYMIAGGLFSLAASGLAGHFIGDWLHAQTTESDLHPIVVSRRAIQLHDITSIEVGQVPDSQRRRRRSQSEARVAYDTFSY
jgi:hypothetical protein